MPTIAIDRSSFGEGVEVDEPEGGRLVDVCDDARAPVPFSCRGASCGTCRVEVLEGVELLEPPGPHEAEVLAIFGDERAVRLACAARVRRGAGRVRLRVVDDLLP